jgi:hypothetical protein
MNPLWLPQSWGRRKKLGDTPKPPAKGLCPSALPISLYFLGKIFSKGSGRLIFAFLHKGNVFFVITKPEVI